MKGRTGKRERGILRETGKSPSFFIAALGFI
jgi:hypothetical protein